MVEKTENISPGPNSKLRAGTELTIRRSDGRIRKATVVNFSDATQCMVEWYEGEKRWTRETSLASIYPLNLHLLDYKGLDTKFANKILNELVTLNESDGDNFKSIAGNETAKQALRETVILPARRPELFTGLRTPPKGILLFGPPGCGKTLLARALAAEAKCTFFSISVSTLTSKWHGEGEKLVKTLFNLARQLAPTIIFIDEIDSFLSKRKENENEGSRSLKTEFMLQFDGFSRKNDEKLLVLGATNRPFDLDDAVLRRFPKRIHIKLPDYRVRSELLLKLLVNPLNPKWRIESKDLVSILSSTENYSGSDLKELATEAAFEPIRSMTSAKFETVAVDDVPPITAAHFISAMKRIRPSVDVKSLSVFSDWNSKFGDVSSRDVAQ